MGKKGLIFGLVLLGMVGLCGCQKADDQAAEDKYQEAEQEEQEEKEEQEQDKENKKKPKTEKEVVQNNGGNFVKVGEDIYYIKVTENALEKTTLFAEYRSQIKPGEECALMCYQPNGEVKEVASVLAQPQIAYYDSCFYVCGRTEDYTYEVWEVQKDSGEKKRVVDARMMDVDPETGRYAALKESEQGSLLFACEGDKPVCKLKLPMGEETHVENAYVRGDYLIYWELCYPEEGENANWGSLYAHHIQNNTTQCLGTMPIGGEDEFGAIYLYPEIDQFVVKDNQLFFIVGYYGGTGHFVNDSAVFQADLAKENSLQYKWAADYNKEPYDDLGELYEPDLPKINLVTYQGNEVIMNSDLNTLQWMKPLPDAQTTAVDLLTRNEFGYDSTNHQSVEVAEYVDGKAYCIIDHVEETPEQSVGWRTAYTVNQVEFCQIDVENQEYTLMESQVFSGGATTSTSTTDHGEYMRFLDGECRALTSYRFEEDDTEYNQDGLYYGEYTIDDLIGALPELETEEIAVSYGFFDFGNDGNEEMIVRMENTDPGYLRWTGIFSINLDGELILESAYGDGYRSNAVLYDSGYLVHSGSNGAASYSTTLNYISEAGGMEDCFRLDELYAFSVGELMYDLVEDPYSVELSYEDELDEQFYVRAYVVPGYVEFSVESRSDNPACTAGEERVLNGLRDAGAVEVSSDVMDDLFDLSLYCTEEIELTSYGYKWKN